MRKIKVHCHYRNTVFYTNYFPLSEHHIRTQTSEENEELYLTSDKSELKAKE